MPPLPQRTLPGGFTVGERAVKLACFSCIVEMSGRLSIWNNAGQGPHKSFTCQVTLISRESQNQSSTLASFICSCRVWLRALGNSMGWVKGTCTKNCPCNLYHVWSSRCHVSCARCFYRFPGWPRSVPTWHATTSQFLTIHTCFDARLMMELGQEGNIVGAVREPNRNAFADFSILTTPAWSSRTNNKSINRYY